MQVCARTRARQQHYADLSVLATSTQFECTGDLGIQHEQWREFEPYIPNLGKFLLTCIPYRRTKFCAQPLLQGFWKRTKFQVRFRPEKLDHSVVRRVSLVYFCLVIVNRIEAKFPIRHSSSTNRVLIFWLLRCRSAIFLLLPLRCLVFYDGHFLFFLHNY